MTPRPRITVLCPYSPWPVNTGARAEMWKHLDVLLELGEVTLLTARGRPAGSDWTEEAVRACASRGIRPVFREDEEPNGPRQWLGIAYAAVAKGLGLEKAFGHANPYHRHAFPASWVRRHAGQAHLVVVFYSYWAHLRTEAPMACVLLDLWSDVMWGGTRRETADLAGCQSVFVISSDELARLRERGIPNLHWSPPVSGAWSAPDAPRIGLVGSENRFNREGLRWLAAAAPAGSPRVRVYGRLAEYARAPCFEPVGRYADAREPYRDCGVMLFTAAHATGVQIKTIEALAAGRAIVARPESVRGLPPDSPGWMVAESAADMWEKAARLSADAGLRAEWSARARHYHATRINPVDVLARLRAAYLGLLRA